MDDAPSARLFVLLFGNIHMTTNQRCGSENKLPPGFAFQSSGFIGLGLGNK